jgi:hypothetical protein
VKVQPFAGGKNKSKETFVGVEMMKIISMAVRLVQEK